MTPRLMDIKETAAVLGQSEKSLRRHRHTLVAKHGFPAPIDYPSRTLLWDREAINRWITAQMPEALRRKSETILPDPVNCPPPAETRFSHLHREVTDHRLNHAKDAA